MILLLNYEKARIISIHAPREGGDFAYLCMLNMVRMISIHAPREGGDLTHWG